MKHQVEATSSTGSRAERKSLESLALASLLDDCDRRLYIIDAHVPEDLPARQMFAAARRSQACLFRGVQPQGHGRRLSANQQGTPPPRRGGRGHSGVGQGPGPPRTKDPSGHTGRLRRLEPLLKLLAPQMPFSSLKSSKAMRGKKQHV